MNEARKYTVEIFGDHYVLMSDDPEENILKVSKMLDSFMQDIAKRSGSKDTKRIAILAALQVGNLLLQAQSLQKETHTVQRKILQRVESVL